MYLFSNAQGEVSSEPPRIHFLDHGFLFGDSIYEVVRLYDARIFAWKEHKARLLQSALRLGFEIESLLPTIETRMKALLQTLKEPNAALRMVITRGVGKLNIDPRTCGSCQVFMAAWKFDEAAMRPSQFRVFIPEVRRNALNAMDPAIKSGNYLNNVMALREALDAGYSDALMLNAQSQLTELTTSNIAWIRKGRVETPSTQSGILHGVTRHFLKKTIEVHEDFYPEELLSEIEEIFAVSTFKEILPICEIKSASGKVWKWKNFDGTLQIHEKLRHTISKDLELQERIF